MINTIIIGKMSICRDDNSGQYAPGLHLVGCMAPAGQNVPL